MYNFESRFDKDTCPLRCQNVPLINVQRLEDLISISPW